MFWFFGHKARAILATQSGTEPALPVLEDEILTTGSPGSPSYMIINHFPSLVLRFLIDEMRDGPYPTLANSWHSPTISTPLAHTNITKQSIVSEEFPGSPVVRTHAFTDRAQVQSLVGN